MKKRWDTLDILKFLCAFAVVGIHRGFSGSAGAATKLLFRCAVPLFFMITGFFYRDILASKREKQQIVKILRLNLETNAFYLCFAIGWNLYKGRGAAGVLAPFKKMFRPENIRDFLLANESPMRLHLWYLAALLYVLIIAAWLAGKKRMGLLVALTPFLLAGDWIFGKYSVYLWHQEIDYIYVRNYLFVGIPFFAIGWVIGRAREWLLKKINAFWMAVFFLGIVYFYRISVLERKFLQQVGAEAQREHYIGTTFMAIFIFLLFLGLEKYAWLRLPFKPIAWLGKRYSALIYILHPVFMSVFAAVFTDKSSQAAQIYMKWRPCWIFLSALALAIVWRLILDLGKKLRSAAL